MPEDSSAKYDYGRQCWLRRINNYQWAVAKCAHPEPLKHCYACQHAGEVVTDG